MFTVNYQDIFIAVPIDKNGVEIELGHDDYGAYIAIFVEGKRIGIPLTAVQIGDMIDSLKEIQRRMGALNT